MKVYAEKVTHLEEKLRLRARCMNHNGNWKDCDINCDNCPDYMVNFETAIYLLRKELSNQ